MSQWIEAELVLVSASFGAYVHNPITQMSLRINDFRTFGQWLAANSKAASADFDGAAGKGFPKRKEAFLEDWNN